MKRTLALIALAALAARPLPARAGAAGGEPFNFLFLDAGARSVGMGGAYTALAADSNALLYNPAGLGAARRYEGTFMHNEHFNGITQEYMGFVTPQGWGASLNHVSYGRIQKTTISNPNGTLGNFGITDLAVGLGYGREIGEGVHAGAGIKLIRETIDNVSAQGYGTDLGVLASVSALPGLSLGFSVQNMGPAVRYQRAHENLPLNVRMGAAYRSAILGRDSAFSFDVSKERSESVLIALGAETVLAKVMAVRVGFNTRNQAGPGVSMGLGWVHKKFGLDYAMVPYGDLGYTHRISATVRWGSKGGGPEPAAKPADVNDPSVHLEKAAQFEDLGMTEEAKAELALAARLLGEDDRGRVRYLERMGGLALMEKQYDRASGYYHDAIALAIRLGFADKTVAEAYAGMGRCLLEKKNLSYAAKFLRKSLEVGPSPETAKDVQQLLQKLQPE